MPSAKSTFSGSVLRLSNGSTAIDSRSVVDIASRSEVRTPVTFSVTEIASATINRPMMPKSRVRPVLGAMEADRSTFFSSLTPSGVISNTQARTSDSMSPASTTTT